jgi:hypothetical protein
MVLGVEISANPLPSTMISLGEVVINEQIHDPVTNTIKVTGLHVRLNVLIEGDIRIGHAQTRVRSRTLVSRASAYELAAQAQIGGIRTTSIGGQYVAMECKGTGGVEQSQPGVACWRWGGRAGCGPPATV